MTHRVVAVMLVLIGSAMMFAGSLETGLWGIEVAPFWTPFALIGAILFGVAIGEAIGPRGGDRG